MTKEQLRTIDEELISFSIRLTEKLGSVDPDEVVMGLGMLTLMGIKELAKTKGENYSIVKDMVNHLIHSIYTALIEKE